MKRFFAASVTAVVLSFGLATHASADNGDRIERSGNTFHKRVCTGPLLPNTANCHGHVVTDALGNPIEHRGQGNGGGGGIQPNITPAGYSPAQLRQAYNITGNGSATQTIAIVDAFGYPNAEADLATYRAQFGLPACTTANGCFKKVNQSGVQGNYPNFNLGWAQETALDLDMASAMCPGCKILLVQANTNSLANLATAVNTAAALGATAISNSYGGGEAGSQSFESAYNHPGIAITVSSGDAGFGVEFPASSPHVTAVGGTSLTFPGGVRTETAWSGAGSGCSTVYAKPAWQTDPLCTNRTIADVSAVADPATGVAVFAPVRRNGTANWVVFGGTSVSAPIIAGIYGVNGVAGNYGQDPYLHTNLLNDVTSGSNGACGGTYLCTAGAGYDGPTGLGTPNGAGGF